MKIMRKQESKMVKSKLTIYKDKNNDWRWTITAKNGKIIAASTEGYTRKRGAIRNLKGILQALEYNDHVFG